MDNNNLISVIIPVYNCERFLVEAIESMLAQTYRPIEVIIINDGSTDRTAEVALRYEPEITYFYQPNAGSSPARNQGVRLSRGGIFPRGFFPSSLGDWEGYELDHLRQRSGFKDGYAARSVVLSQIARRK